MPKFVWYVQCPRHIDIKQHFIQKTQAMNYYKWHLKAGCMDVMPPELVEAPYLG